MPTGDIFNVFYRYNAYVEDNNISATAGINMVEKFKIILRSLKILN